MNCATAYTCPPRPSTGIRTISGGMAQRAAIAAAIVADPAVIVADEPTSALDPELAEGIWGTVRRSADAGAAVLVITHDMHSLLESGVASSIAVMRSGTVVEQRDPVGLRLRNGSPYVRSFLKRSSEWKGNHMTITSTTADRIALRDGIQAIGPGVRLGGANIIDNIDLHIPAGQFTGITGPSGTGKTIAAAMRGP